MSNEEDFDGNNLDDGEADIDPAVVAERALLVQEARDAADYTFKHIYIHRANLFSSQILLSYLQRALPNGTKRAPGDEDFEEEEDNAPGGTEAGEDEDFTAINDVTSNAVPALTPQGTTSVDSFIDARALPSRGFQLVASLPHRDAHEQRSERLMRNRRRQSDVEYITCRGGMQNDDAWWTEIERELMQCDVAVFNIADADDDANSFCKEARRALDFLHTRWAELPTPKKFILLSPAITWSRTKPADPDDDPEVPFREDEYRRRRAHAKYSAHQALEKDCLKCGRTRKNKLMTFVVCSGIAYGLGEGILHYFFRQAWQQDLPVRLPGQGNCELPLVHVWDLCQILHNIIDRIGFSRYIVAVDDSQHTTLNDIVRVVVKKFSGENGLAGGAIKRTKNIADFLRDEDRSGYKHLATMHRMLACTTTVRLQAGVVKEAFQVNWAAEQGLLENIDTVLAEFRASRMLKPKKVCIIGPPCSGKSSLAAKLADYYNIPHYSLKRVLSESMAEYQTLTQRKAAAEAAAIAADAHDDEEEVSPQRSSNAPRDNSTTAAPPQTDTDLVLDLDEQELEILGEKIVFLEEIFSQQELSDGGQLSETVLPKLFRYKLKKGPAQNQGYILDGYPSTEQMARDLYSLDAEQLEEIDADQLKLPQYERMIIPDVVVMLQATEDFLVSQQYESTDEIRRKFDTYRATARAEGEQEVAKFFDHNEIHPLIFDLNKLALNNDSKFQQRGTPGSRGNDSNFLKSTPYTDTVFDRIVAELGAPTNYGPSREEYDGRVKARRAAQQQYENDAKDALARLGASSLVDLQRRVHSERWTARYTAIKTEEATLLALRAMPARTYLMKFIVPTVLDGMEACVKARPDDVAEFIADYLMRRVRDAGQSMERAALGEAVSLFTPLMPTSATFGAESGDSDQ